MTSDTAEAAGHSSSRPWRLRLLPIESDEASILAMWMVTGLLVGSCHYIGAWCDPSSAGSPVLEFLIFCIWGMVAMVVGAVTTAGRSWPRSVSVLAHVVAALAATLLSLYLCQLLASPRPVRFPLLLGRDALVGLSAYCSGVMSFLVLRLTREIGESTRREAQLAAALAAAEVRAAGSAAGQLRGFLAEIRERLRISLDSAEQFATAAAALMRAWLKARMSSRWTLADEIQLLDRETDIDRLRSGVRTRVAVDSDPLLLAREVVPGTAVEVWRECSREGAADRDLQLVIEPRAELLSISAQMGGAVIAERLSAPPPAPQSDPRMAFATIGRWVGEHRKLAAVMTIITAIAVGVSISALNRAAAVPLHVGWLVFMSLRATLWVSFAAFLSRQRPVAFSRIGLLAFASAVAGEIIFALLVHFFIFPPAGNLTRLRNATGMAFTSVYFPTMITLAVIHLLTAIRSISELVDGVSREAEASARFRSAQLRALRWQVNPHLLFNALNSAAALIRSEPVVADRFLRQLESFYSRLGQNGDREFVPLAEELELVREYLRIEAVRFPSLRANFDLDESFAREEVPRLLLQPVIENAVKFGSPDQEIIISAARHTDGWSISVSSDVAARSRPGAGMGLVILEERLRGHYGDGAALQCRRDHDRNVTTIVFGGSR